MVKRKSGASRPRASKPPAKQTARRASSGSGTGRASAARSVGRAARATARSARPPKVARGAKPDAAVKAGRVVAKAAKAGSSAVKVLGAAVKGVRAAVKSAKAPLPAPGAKAVAVKPPLTKAEGKLRKPIVKVVAPKPTPPVRPLGVLPPEAVARATHRPSPAALSERPAKRPVRETLQTQGAQGVTEKDYKEFEQRLLVERQKILKEMGHLENTVLKINQRESAGDLSGYSFHMADVGTDAMEREKAFLFASAEGRLLMEINEALRRVYRGEYGVCENCGQPIARARLEAMPYARLCLSCKEKEERASRGAS
jgi:RNA polymerase-binding transcription factor